MDPGLRRGDEGGGFRPLADVRCPRYKNCCCFVAANLAGKFVVSVSHDHRWAAANIALILMLVSSCVRTGAVPLRSDPARLAPWTRALRDQRPDDPYVLVYGSGEARLIFVAAQHENAVNSATFRLIDRAFTLWPVRSVVVEGSSAALGPNPRELMEIATRSRPNPVVDADGETSPAIRNAIKAGASIYGGEADDLAVRDFARNAGIKDVDLLGYYILRVIPQWVRDGSIAGPADPRLIHLVNRQRARSAAELGIASTVMPEFADFESWYQRTNRKPLAAGVDQEEAGPLVDGPWQTNRVGAAVSRARDASLVKQIADRLNKDGSVLVVFGASHAMIDKPALDFMLGRPCYAGSDMTAAAKTCAAHRQL